MKLAYFHLLAADNDDHDLGAAKVMGYVPPTCLLGGALVWREASAGRDPCTTCLCDRAKCKGRPKPYMPPISKDIEELFRLDFDAPLVKLVDRGGTGETT